MFLKKIDRCYGFQKRLDLGQYVFFCSFFLLLLGIESPLDSTVGNVSAKLGVGCFLDISNPCISKTVGDFKTNMEVLGRLRTHILIM